jgi:uncharacterized protein YodC (DUF2158 family)
MTKEKLQKHGRVIKWLIDNVDKGVLRLCNTSTNEWCLDMEPSFYEDSIYIQNDEYAELRKAIVSGKYIQKNTTQSTPWQDFTQDYDGKFYCPLSEYRIKPDAPKFKVGDWVVRINDGQLHQIAQDSPLSGTYKSKWYKLWVPKIKELCVFWDDKETDDENIEYYIGKYGDYSNMLGYDFIKKSWDHVAPLEFVESLKE